MKARLEFEPRDIWIGVYWNRGTRFDVWVTVVPMLPLHLWTDA